MNSDLDVGTEKETRRWYSTTYTIATVIAIIAVCVGLVWGAFYLEDVKKGVNTRVVGEGQSQTFVVRMEKREKGASVVIHCSEDGFEDAFTKFKNHLGVDEPPFDIPGGPMVIALAHADLSEDLQKVKRAAVEILKRHSPQRIVLVAHSECLFYDSIGAWQNRLGKARERQYADLEQAVRVLREWFPQSSIEAYYAEKEGEELHFNRIIVPFQVKQKQSRLEEGKE